MIRLWFLSTRAHLLAHWSNPSHFWSGFIGMLVNNAIVIGTLWAMLFAGRPELSEQGAAFGGMTFVTMTSWGFIHIFLGGWTELGSQIDGGGLDSALMTPRAPLVLTALTASYIPAWGDFLMGIAGLAVMAATRYGPLFLLNGLLMSALAAAALGGVFILIGSLGFWARRNERLTNTLLMVIISVNGYPIFDSVGDSLKWLLVFAPLTVVGVIPARFLLHPDAATLAAETAAAMILFFGAIVIFRRGLRRYQSTPAFTGARA
jgi:ABC-2 type transport system permease protein